jgi:hypothetical protein
MLRVTRDCCLALGVVLVSLWTESAYSQDAARRTWVEIPVDGMLTILSKDDVLPILSRDIAEDAASGKKRRSRTNPEKGVFLTEDQVLELSTEGTGPDFNNLTFLDAIPSQRLRSLSLLTDRISARGLRRVKCFTELRQLNVWCEELEDFPALVKACPSLEYISLESFDPGDPDQPEGNVFADHVCSHFAGWKKLRCARVCGRRFTDKAVAELAMLPNIEGILVCGSFKVTDEGAKSLLAARQLREIVLSVGPKFTDEGVRELIKLERLQWIEIEGMEKVEPATIDALKARFPNAHIEFKPRVNP